MLDTGWLSPDGTFTKCKVYEHISTAYTILNDYTTSCPDEKLHEAGYAEITISMLGVKTWRIYWKKFLTEEQKNFLRPYFEDPERDVDLTSRISWDKENDI